MWTLSALCVSKHSLSAYCELGHQQGAELESENQDRIPAPGPSWALRWPCPPDSLLSYCGVMDIRLILLSTFQGTIQWQYIHCSAPATSIHHHNFIVIPN